MLSPHNSSKNCFEIILCLMEPGPLYLIFLPSRLRERQERNGMRVASALLRWSEEHSIALYQNELMKSLINFITPILRCAPFDAFSLKVQLIPRSENKRQTCTPPTTPRKLKVLPQNVRCINHPDTNRYYQGGIACLSAGLPQEILTPTTVYNFLSLCFSAIPMRLHNLSDWANEAN